MERNELELLFGKKGKVLCGFFFRMESRFPKLFPKTTLRDLGRFLSNSSENFLENRPTRHLAKVIFGLSHVLKKKNESRCNLKVIELSSSVFGLSIGIFPDHGHEIFFYENTLIREIENLIPGIKPIPHSFLAFRNEDALLLYIEIRKMRGGSFSYDDKIKLSKELALTIENGLKVTTPSLFLPGNEEALFKNIRQLGKELKFVDDFPQVMITFIEYFQDTLKFLAIAVRIVKPQIPSIIELSSKLAPWLNFSLENTIILDRVRKKYPKEASVFTLEISSSLFANAQGINLRMARRYIVKALESMLGPFRDYNGGLLNKESEQLLTLKRALEKKGMVFSALEKFFYGIKALGMRSLVTVHTGLELASLFQKIQETPLGSNIYLIESCHKEEVDLALVKTREKKIKNALTQSSLTNVTGIGSSFFEHKGDYYLCFFHQYPSEKILFTLLQEELKKSTLTKDTRNSILSINFQGGDPPSLNPRLANDIHCNILSNLLFEGLTYITPEGKVELAAAEKILVSDCRKHYTVHLKTSWWSNGEEVTAYHFERAWKKALTSGSTSRIYIDFFSPIKNGKKIRDKAVSIHEVGIKSKDAKTLAIELESPCSYFLNLLSTSFFFPLLGDSEEPRYFNGPFMLSEWKRDEYIVLSKNPFYREAHKVKLDGIKIHMVKDPYLACQMFQRGELDLIGDPISPLPPDLLLNQEFKDNLFYKPVSRVFWIHCNTNLAPLNNANLRRALSLSINRKLITEKVFINQIPHVSPLPLKYSSVVGEIEGDRELAREYFQRALSDLKLNQKDFPRLVISHSDLSFEKELISLLQAQWQEALGISVHSRALPWNEFSASLEHGNFQLGGLFRRDFYSHPMFYLNFFKPALKNSHSWENKRYDELLDHLHKEENAVEYLKEMERLLVQEAPVISLINQVGLLVVNHKVKGVSGCENGCLDLKEAQIDEKVD